MRVRATLGSLGLAVSGCVIQTLPGGEESPTGDTSSSGGDGASGESSSTGGPSGDEAADESSGGESSTGGEPDYELLEGLLQSLDTDLCVGAGMLAEAEPLVSSQCASASALRLETSGPLGAALLRVVDTELCVTLASDTSEDGEPLALDTCADEPTQRFALTSGPTDLSIESSGSCLDFGPGAGPGEPLVQRMCDGMDSQRFLFIDEAPSLPPVLGIIDDMAEDASCEIAELVGGRIQAVQPGGYPSTQSSTVMGFMAHGQASPDWWNPSPGFEWVRTTNWPRVTPWTVAMSCIDNDASETRIEMRSFRVYALLASTGDWQAVVPSSVVDGFVCPPGQWDRCSGETDITIEDGVTSVLAAGTGSNFHGWSTEGGYIEDPNDVQLLVATLEARVVGPDVDDSRYVLHVGTDYYPAGLGVSELGGYNPGAGFSRSRLLTTQWETFSFATIDASPSINAPQWVAPTEVLEANPPPGFE